jgi:hypothetical protein
MEEGAVDGTVLGNVALDNSSFDLRDFNVDCDNNMWKANWFKTSNQDCIK